LSEDEEGKERVEGGECVSKLSERRAENVPPTRISLQEAINVIPPPLSVRYCIRYCTLYHIVYYIVYGAFTTLFLILCVMQFQQALLPISGQTAGQAAGLSRSTSGCGAMGERSPERDAAEVCTRGKTEGG
jgi:hypothetical protein